MGAPDKVLVVDDDEEILDVLGEFLRESGHELLLAHDGNEAFRIFRAECPALVLVDLKMPGMDGLTLMRAIKEADPRTETLIMTGHADLDSAVEAVRDGAFDYLVKPLELATLGRRVSQALERHQLVCEREALLAELEERVRARTAALEKSQRRLRALFDGIPDALLIVDESFTIVAANESAAGLFETPAAALIGRKCYQQLSGSDTPCSGCPAVSTLATAQMGFSTTSRDFAGPRGRREFEVRTYPLGPAGGPIQEVVEHFRDVTERRRAEEERRALEAQRKVDEAIRMIGGLAAGAAHDFNTLLTIIKGCAEFLLDAIPPGDVRRSDAERIEAAVDRGRGLVRELMAFRGADPMEARSVNVAGLVEAMVPMLRSLLGDDIVLPVLAAPHPWHIHADAAQIEQLITNLITNARDAIAPARGQPSGGMITVEVGNVVVESTSSVAPEGPPPGQYVMLAVGDTGCGMTPEVRRRIFEPFFTTKSAGRGTGLGLAIVSWIVRRYDGHIVCESEPGQGSVFRIYLPRDDRQPR